MQNREDPAQRFDNASVKRSSVDGDPEQSIRDPRLESTGRTAAR